MCQPNCRTMYKQWDEALAQKGCDYSNLEHQLVTAMKESISPINNNVGDPEILWRLSATVYYKSLNLDDEETIKMETIRSMKYAQKAIQTFETAFKMECFQAHKWMAITSGKLSLLESDPGTKVKYASDFFRYINKCIQESPCDPVVLFMQGRFYLAMTMLTEDEKKQLKDIPNQLKLDSDQAEHKLRQSIELNPNLFDSYITLAYLLIKSNQIDEAKTLIRKGLQIQPANKSEEVIHNEMKKIQETLG